MNIRLIALEFTLLIAFVGMVTAICITANVALDASIVAIVIAALVFGSQVLSQSPHKENCDKHVRLN